MIPGVNAPLKEMIESGKIKIEINPEKQNRHSLGHHLYNENKKKSHFK